MRSGTVRRWLAAVFILLVGYLPVSASVCDVRCALAAGACHADSMAGMAGCAAMGAAADHRTGAAVLASAECDHARCRMPMVDTVPERFSRLTVADQSIAATTRAEAPVLSYPQQRRSAAPARRPVETAATLPLRI